uniref:Uncharacterized protein n=1 Tax=Alexandrium monilatum TaxID=311494 RepID=A0A7S4V5R5_9DINO
MAEQTHTLQQDRESVKQSFHLIWKLFGNARAPTEAVGLLPRCLQPSREPRRRVGPKTVCSSLPAAPRRAEQQAPNCPLPIPRTATAKLQQDAARHEQCEAVPGEAALPVDEEDLASNEGSMPSHTLKETLSRRLLETQKQLLRLQLGVKAQQLEQLHAKLQASKMKMQGNIRNRLWSKVQSHQAKVREQRDHLAAALSRRRRAPGEALAPEGCSAEVGGSP